VPATTSSDTAKLAGLPLVGKTSEDVLLRAVGRDSDGHDR
jgi:hypothetical protein